MKNTTHKNELMPDFDIYNTFFVFAVDDVVFSAPSLLNDKYQNNPCLNQALVL